MLWCEKRKPFNISMLTNKAAIFKLRKEIRGALKTLTVAEEAMIEADGVVDGYDLQLMLTLEDFEHECMEVFQMVAALVRKVMEESSTPCTECVLVGGAMRMRRVQKLVQTAVESLGGTVKKTLDMDRAVSYGASTVVALHCSETSLKTLPLDASEPYAELPQRRESNLDDQDGGKKDNVGENSSVRALTVEESEHLRAQVCIRVPAFVCVSSVTHKYTLITLTPILSHKYTQHS